MSRTLRFAVADDDPDMQEYDRTILPQLGHVVVAVVPGGRELIATCRQQHPDLVITDIKMPDMDGIDVSTQIGRDGPTPIILVTAYHDPGSIDRAIADHILCYLVKPIKQADLETAITVVMRRFEQFQELRREATDLRQALEDRKLIERAKGLLMKKASLDEAEAFRRLHRLSNDRNLKLVETARMLLTAEEAFRPPEAAGAPIPGGNADARRIPMPNSMRSPRRKPPGYSRTGPSRGGPIPSTNRAKLLQQRTTA
jgi:response regulator NasT